MGRDEKDKNLTTKPTLVLVQTCAYSGATLLAFLLGSHPQIATVGEMNGMLDVDIDTYLCSCGQRIKDCGFWQSVEIAMRDKGFEFDIADFRTRFLPVGSPLAYRLRMRFSRIPSSTPTASISFNASKETRS